MSKRFDWFHGVSVLSANAAEVHKHLYGIKDPVEKFLAVFGPGGEALWKILPVAKGQRGTTIYVEYEDSEILNVNGQVVVRLHGTYSNQENRTHGLYQLLYDMVNYTGLAFDKGTLSTEKKPWGFDWTCDVKVGDKLCDTLEMDLIGRSIEKKKAEIEKLKKEWKGARERIRKRHVASGLPEAEKRQKSK